MRSKAYIYFLTLALLLSSMGTASAHRIPDHMWIPYSDDTHPIIIAWDNPDGSGLHKSVHVWLSLGAFPAFEIAIPLVVGLLLLGAFVALLHVLARRFNRHDHAAASAHAG